jgi:hypothetical protein
MKPSKIAGILEIALQKGYNVLLKGSPGISKTSVIEQVAKKLDYDFITSVASMSDPTDYRGLPSFNNGVAEFLPYSFLKKMLTAEKPLVVFFDDVGWASPATVNCLASLILNREVNEQKISPHVRFVSATNQKKDNSNVNNLSLAFLSRFHMVLEMKISSEDWINWAINNNVNEFVIAYIKNRPEMLSTFTGAREEQFACPRTIKYLSDLIESGIIDLESWSACVGQKFGIEFFAFYQLIKQVGNLPAEIMLNPKTARVDLSPDLLYFIIISLANRSVDSNKFEIAMQYIERIPVEFQVFAVKLITTKNPKFMETISYISWGVKNQSAIQ